MDTVIFFESLMLIIFGLSWPANIYKSLTSKTTLGKSVVFEFMIVIGYCCGIIAKILIYKRTGEFHASFWFYLIDILLVSTDIVLYFRNLKIDKKMGRI